MNDPTSQHVLVVGGGTMGAGIAQNLLQIGCPVTVREASAEAAEAALGRVTDGLNRAHRKADDPASLVAADLARLDIVDTLPDAEPDLVIEAVPELVDLKARVLAELADHYPTTLLATNTSSLSITELATHVSAPERFIGMHFFNPVPVSSLVELVVGEATDEATVEASRRWVERLDKTAIVVNDSPGFATSRLGLALGLEAIRMVEQGVAAAEDIDRGMELGYKHPMGPLRLTDLVGLDVRLGIAEHLASTLGPRFEPPDLLRQMVAEGKLGRKSGEGFYSWT
ncbi:MAG: 3-hydroxyacyl-CoA dehydrogenase family protein [Acidimicrobiia bacterium]|nr:3-hydroxyacyl-CoA dehydrogenase family protein [Acidimicrobiia bacterium]